MDSPAAPDTYIITSDEETGNWVAAPIPNSAGGRERYAFVIKKEKKLGRNIIDRPISSWKASAEWKTDFDAEVSNHCMLWLEYVETSRSRSIKPLSRNHFVYDKMMQSGWKIKHGKFCIP